MRGMQMYILLEWNKLLELFVVIYLQVIDNFSFVF